MDIVRRGAVGPHLMITKRRTVNVRRQVIFSKMNSNFTINQPLSVAQGSFFIRKDEIGTERLDETPPGKRAAKHNYFHDPQRDHER